MQLRLGTSGPILCTRLAAPANSASDDAPTRYRSKAVTAGAAACSPAPAACGACADPSSHIEHVSTTAASGFEIDSYRNLDDPCSISGHQTFAIARRQGTDPAAPRPLWVFMHGGGVGYFDGLGVSRPDAQYMAEESRDALLYSPAGGLADPGLMSLIAQDAAGFRAVGVSMCSHDFYAGIDQSDPNNPNPQPDGSPATTNGLVATEAAIRFAKASFATTKVFVHGGSAGSVGSYGLAWSLQRHGEPPAGVIADSGVLNQEWLNAVLAQNVSCPPPSAPSIVGSQAAIAAVAARMDPEIADPANEPDTLVASGRLTVPLLNLWAIGDPYYCGSTPMQCPLRDGSTVTMGGTDRMYEPRRAAECARGTGGAARSAGRPRSPPSPCGRLTAS